MTLLFAIMYITLVAFVIITEGMCVLIYFTLPSLRGEGQSWTSLLQFSSSFTYCRSRIFVGNFIGARK